MATADPVFFCQERESAGLSAACLAAADTRQQLGYAGRIVLHLCQVRQHPRPLLHVAAHAHMQLLRLTRPHVAAAQPSASLMCICVHTCAGCIRLHAHHILSMGRRVEPCAHAAGAQRDHAFPCCRGGQHTALVMCTWRGSGCGLEAPRSLPVVRVLVTARPLAWTVRVPRVVAIWRRQLVTRGCSVRVPHIHGWPATAHFAGLWRATLSSTIVVSAGGVRAWFKGRQLAHSSRSPRALWPRSQSRSCIVGCEEYRYL